MEITINPDGTPKLSVEMLEVANFVDSIAPDSIKHFGGIFSDQIKGLRTMLALKMMKRVQSQIEESGLDTSSIELKTFLPLVENASLEEDANLQEKWDNLLKNAATKNTPVQARHIETLKEISSDEANVLDSMYSLQIQDRYDHRYYARSLGDDFGYSYEQAQMFIQNMIRLNLLEYDTESRSSRFRPRLPRESDLFNNGTNFGNGTKAINTDAVNQMLEAMEETAEQVRESGKQPEYLKFTYYGKEFMRACKWNPSNAIDTQALEE